MDTYGENADAVLLLLEKMFAFVMSSILSLKCMFIYGILLLSIIVEIFYGGCPIDWPLEQKCFEIDTLRV